MVSIKNKSFSVTAEVESPKAAEGVIIAQGGRFGGWASMPRTAKPSSSTTCSASRSSPTEATEPIPAGQPPGAHGVRLRRRRPGQGRQRHPVLRRHRGRHRSGRRHPADDLLRRRDHRHRLRVRYHRHARLHRRTTAGSPARSTGCSSISARTITTTSSTRRSASGRHGAAVSLRVDKLTRQPIWTRVTLGLTQPSSRTRRSRPKGGFALPIHPIRYSRGWHTTKGMTEWRAAAQKGHRLASASACER